MSKSKHQKYIPVVLALIPAIALVALVASGTWGSETTRPSERLEATGVAAPGQSASVTEAGRFQQVTCPVRAVNVFCGVVTSTDESQRGIVGMFVAVAHGVTRAVLANTRTAIDARIHSLEMTRRLGAFDQDPDARQGELMEIHDLELERASLPGAVQHFHQGTRRVF